METPFKESVVTKALQWKSAKFDGSQQAEKNMK